jgi:DUF1680 family protein
MVDVAAIQGDPLYRQAVEKIWNNVVSRKLYITGAIGARHKGEAFGDDFELPNREAYGETCASVANVYWNQRMFLQSGDAKYIDVLERGIYNNALSGVSPSGDRFFYVNRLASAGDGRDTRWERASLECCPPNLVRFFASMPGYIYAQDGRSAIYVNLYVSSGARFDVGNKALGLEVESEMPWSGKTTILASAAEPVRAVVKLRIPGWARNRVAPGSLYSYAGALRERTAISINGRRVSAAPDAQGYVPLDREWRSGDRIELELPFDIKTVTADDRVRETRGRVAIERGPLVYCVEEPASPNPQATAEPAAPKPEATAGALDVRFESETELSVSRGTEPDVAPSELRRGRPITITAAAKSLSNPSAPGRAITLIPYYTWANRGSAEMSVWIPTRDYVPGDTGPAGGFIFYVNPNYAADGWRYLEAAPVDQSLGATWGCFRREINGARGTAIGTGRQNARDMLAACAERGTAADLCTAYVLNGIGGWFLPSLDELTAMYKNLKATRAADFRDQGMADNCQYWTSSQQTTDMANHIDFADNGRVHYDDKDFPRRVRAIRAF